MPHRCHKGKEFPTEKFKRRYFPAFRTALSKLNASGNAVAIHSPLEEETMWIRRTKAVIWIASLMLIWTKAQLWAQGAPAAKGRVQTATEASSSVSAELVKGKLNPATSKPGGKIAVRLNDDVRSNGTVLLRKGTRITGVVKNAKQADSNSKASARSMMEIEWLAPAASGAATQNLNIALKALS